MFYNWYDPHTGAKLRIWPENGNVVKPFLSSVDNGWLATALLLVSRADKALAKKADALRTTMDFGFYYNAAENAPGGQIRGGFWDEDPHESAAVKGNYRNRGPDVWYTGHHYGAFNTEPRIASYLGIASGQIPREHYFGTYRTFQNENCDYAWTETKPVGEWKTYLGVRVFEGALPYRGMDIVPTWGGSMFEALMVPLFVPEETWGPKSWGVNHPLFVKGQIEHGLDEAKYGYWGFSPSSDPAGGYREYGVDQLGLDGAGYTSDEERTTVDQPFDGCRTGSPAPTSYGDGVVTPHASFLALRYAPQAALANLAKMRTQPARLRSRRVLRRRRDPQRQGRPAVPVARPGHDHGRPRQRPRRQRHASLRLHGRHGEQAASADGHGGVRLEALTVCGGAARFTGSPVNLADPQRCNSTSSRDVHVSLGPQ